MKVPFVSFRPMERELDQDLRGAFERVFKRSWYIEGEEEFVTNYIYLEQFSAQIREIENKDGCLVSG